MPNNYTSGYELILNACEGSLQIIITENSKQLCSSEWDIPDKSTEILFPQLQSIQKTLGFKWNKIARIACVNGPGSFTGIRLILITASTLMRTGKAQIAAINYLRTLATSLAIDLQLKYNQKIHVITHARRNLVHYQPFIAFGPEIPAYPLKDINLISPDEAMEKISKDDYACGSAINKYREIFIKKDAHIFFEKNHPTTQALCMLAKHGEYFSKDIEPLYIRSCDAIDNLPHIAKKYGFNEEKAMEEINNLLKKEPKSEYSS